MRSHSSGDTTVRRLLKNEVFGTNSMVRRSASSTDLPSPLNCSGDEAFAPWSIVRAVAYYGGSQGDVCHLERPMPSASASALPLAPALAVQVLRLGLASPFQ